MSRSYAVCPSEESLSAMAAHVADSTEYEALTLYYLMLSCTQTFANEEDRKDWVIIQTVEHYQRNMAAAQLAAKE